MIKVKWFGHSMWKFSTKDVSIIIDPFTDIGYKMPQNETADIVISSHDHFDHNNISLIKGNPLVINKEGNYNHKGITIETIQVWHDEHQGKDRGKNLLIKIMMDGKTLLHCGDLGHTLSDDIIKKLGKIDMLFIPVGGVFTINSQKAKEIIDKLNPTLVFPMHYKTSKIDFNINPLDEFLAIAKTISYSNGNETDITNNDLVKHKTMVMNYE